MKTEVRNEFILEAHKIACSEWKLKIEKECPELFKTKLEVGKWYKAESHKAFMFIDKISISGVYGYGFDYKGNYTNEWNAYFPLNSEYTLATEEEVKEALVKEAKKRGFKEGVNVKSVNGTEGIITNNYKHEFKVNNNRFYFHNMSVFENGVWAEIISNPIEEKINDLQKQIDELKKQL